MGISGELERSQKAKRSVPVYLILFTSSYVCVDKGEHLPTPLRTAGRLKTWTTTLKKVLEPGARLGKDWVKIFRKLTQDRGAGAAELRDVATSNPQPAKGEYRHKEQICEANVLQALLDSAAINSALRLQNVASAMS